MPRKRIKKNKSGRSQEPIAGADIISDLPRNVIDCILGKMPIREAIRTSVLSKKWRFYYLTVPQLVFDDQFYKELEDSTTSDGRLKYKFDEIVTKSLLLHPGRIEKFKVWFPYFRLKIPDVNKWILFLSRKNIEKLTIEYKTSTLRRELPPYFFSCLDLTHLKLRNFLFLPPPEFKGFLHLEQLKLLGVHLANNCFEDILSSCPVLKRLVLSECSGVRRFNISGSKLTRLCIRADDKFESISLENAPNLTEVSVALEKVVIGLEDSPVSDLVKFVDSLPKVKILRLDGKFLQFLAQTQCPIMLSTLPPSLKIMEFKDVNFNDLDQISSIVCLIRSAHLNLRELHIEASTVELNQEQVSGYLELLDCTTSPLSELHLAKVTKISGFASELEFIKFLLFGSPSLVKMSIVEHPDLEMRKALAISNKLLQFRRPPSDHVFMEFITRHNEDQVS